LFTGRDLVFSATRQALIGYLAAGVTFVIGRLVGVSRSSIGCHALRRCQRSSLRLASSARPSGGASGTTSDFSPAIASSGSTSGRLQLSSELSPLPNGVSGASLRLDLPPAELTIESRLASKIRSPGDAATDCRLSSEPICPAVRRFGSRFASRPVSPVVPATRPSACASDVIVRACQRPVCSLRRALDSSAPLANQIPAHA